MKQHQTSTLLWVINLIQNARVWLFFLIDFMMGQELSEDFITNAKKKIVPQVRGKRVIEV